MVVHLRFPPGRSLRPDGELIDVEIELVAHFGEERGNQLHLRFGNAFPASYRQDCSVAEAVTDAAVMDGLGAEKRLATNLYAGDASSATPLRLRVD